MNEDSSILVISLASSLVELMHHIDQDWRVAYFRFSSEGSKYGSNGSYVTGSEVKIIDTFENEFFFDQMNFNSINLLGALKKDRGVILLRVESNSSYEVKYEFHDVERWKITKMNGGSGLPE
ncbi:hypothetical protein [Xanthomonas oryzae]|uniref:hypothetical protein n=1 Tax=Xanthomonas oryzae TaxID=347 RepID=UPI0010354215|nr:hypothetical protein [Xanthomonas oryzae]QBH01564.1 hypothetical protein EYC56_22910 [Xanthomonas oryzae]